MTLTIRRKNASLTRVVVTTFSYSQRKYNVQDKKKTEKSWNLLQDRHRNQFWVKYDAEQIRQQE